MNDQRKTWTGLLDVEDPMPKPCTIAEDQVEYLQDHLGWVMYAWLQEMEEEDAPRP